MMKIEDENIEIRSFQPSDYAGICLVEKEGAELFQEYAQSSEQSPFNFPDMDVDSLLAEGDVLVAVCKNIVAGFIVFQFYPLEKDVYICEIDVGTLFRGKKLGKSLVDRAVLEAEGCQRVTLTTYNSIPWNAPYYKKYMGFDVLDEDVAPAYLIEKLRLEKDVMKFPYPEDRVMMARWL